MDNSGDIPRLNARLPSRKDIMLTTKQPELPVDVLLLTVEDCEFLPCYSLLKGPVQWYFESLGYVYFADIDKRQEGELKVALIRCPDRGSPCIGSGFVTVSNAVHILRPKAVISVGTCTGLNSKNTKLGDVVVSSKLTTYTSKEAVVNQVQSTAKRSYVSRRFSNVIKNCADGWQTPLKNSEARDVRVHCGEFLVGSGLVNTKQQHKQLAELHPQAVAIEMDGEGIFAAAYDLPFEWVIVKGIADFGDTALLTTEHSWYSFASVMAASLVAHILSDPGIFCSWPHFGDTSSQLLPKVFSIPEKGSEDLLAILKCLQCHNINVEKTSNGLYLQEWINPSLEGVKMSDKHFKTLQQSVKLRILKPWSDSQSEFVVLDCNDSDDFNLMNYLAILSLFAFTKGDTNSLVKIQAIAVRYKHHPGCGFMMSNLGVMFSEKVDYEKSKECFDIAKGYFDLHQDHLGDAAVTLNQAVLHHALGNYALAKSLCYEAAVICSEISVKMPDSAHLLFKVLGRTADIVEEIGDYKTFNKILKTCALSDIAGGSKTVLVVLIQQLMKLQLKKEADENFEATEVKDFVYYLFTLLDNPAAELMNAVVVRTVVIAATLHHSAGYNDEAYDLLKKLQNGVLLAHGKNSCLYGSLLYQIGCFLTACEKFDEALSAVKQAVDILISRFGQEHHTVALCLNMLGSCFLLKGNKKEALKHLNDALTKFRNLNSKHPEVGAILLKLLNFEEEADVQYAHDIVERALEIFTSSCGELSPKMATGYVQSTMLLLKDKALWSSAEEKLMRAIDIFLRLGLKPTHSCVIACRGLLGVLQLSLRKKVEAEKSFVDVNQQFDLNNELWIETNVALAPPCFSLLIPSPMVGLNRSFSLCAKIVALVNLLHMKNGNERQKLVDALVSCVEKHKIEQLQISDFAGQEVYCISHKLPHSDRPIVCILSSDPEPLASDSGEGLSHLSFEDTSEAHGKREGSHMFLSSINNKHFGLFLRVSHNIHQKGNFHENGNFLAFAFHMSVVTLFSQPSLQTGFLDRNDFYREMTVPTLNMSSPWSLIECLPLLVELELSELQEQCDDFDYLNSWESSVRAIEPPLHICYFSSECSSQRGAEFVFDRLSHRLEEKLEGNKSQGVVICDVFPVQNAASFVTETPRKSFTSIAVQGKLVIVKCCSFKESDLHYICSLVDEAVENIMEPNHVVSVNFKQSSWLRDLGSVRGFKESGKENCSANCADLTLEIGDLMPCAGRRDSESDLYREPTFDVLHDKDARPLLSHSCDKFRVDIDVCLSLLECLLSQASLEALKEEDLGAHKEWLPYFDCRDGDINVNRNHSISSSLSDKSEGPLDDLHDSNPRPSSAASSVSTVSENLTCDFENVLAASQEQCLRLQQEIGQLEERLKQSEEEKQKLQVDLGKYLFFEEKEKRCGRLLGGAASLYEPGFSMHSRLLEISNALTEEEVKRIKFLAKSKINGFRLARITEVFELFEELETNGAFSCRYIANLLAAIQRHDLVEKLGIQIPLTAAKGSKGSRY